MIALPVKLIALFIAVRGQYIPSLSKASSEFSSSIPEEFVRLGRTFAWRPTRSTEMAEAVATSTVADTYERIGGFKRQIDLEGTSRNPWSVAPGIFNGGYSQDHIYNWASVDNDGNFPESEALPVFATNDDNLPTVTIRYKIAGESRPPRDLDRDILTHDVEGISRSSSKDKFDYNSERKERSSRTKAVLDFAQLAQEPLGSDFVTEEEMTAVKCMIMEAREMMLNSEAKEQELHSLQLVFSKTSSDFSVSETPLTSVSDESGASSASPSVVPGSRYSTQAVTEAEANALSELIVEAASHSSGLTSEEASTSDVFNDLSSIPSEANTANIGAPTTEFLQAISVTSSSLTTTSIKTIPGLSQFLDAVSTSTISSTMSNPEDPVAESTYKTSSAVSEFEGRHTGQTTEIARSPQAGSSDTGHVDLSSSITEKLPKQDTGDESPDLATSEHSQHNSDETPEDVASNPLGSAQLADTARTAGDQAKSQHSEVKISTHERLYHIASNSMKPDASIEEAILARSFKYMYERKYQTAAGDETNPGEILLMFLRGQTAATSKEVEQYEEMFGSVFKLPITNTSPSSFGDLGKLPFTNTSPSLFGDLGKLPFTNTSPSFFEGLGKLSF